MCDEDIDTVDARQIHPGDALQFIGKMEVWIDLLFSVANAAQLSSQQGKSAKVVRGFLDELGRNWFPARMNLIEVMQSELRCESPGAACIDQDFLKAYFAERLRVCTGVIDCSDENLFRLGYLLVRLSPQWPSISATSTDWDRTLKAQLTKVHARGKRNKAWFNQRFPQIPFEPTRPANFAFHNLLRTLALDPGSVKPDDGVDFCHAVMGSAYASFAALDKHWKRRIEKLPKPNRLAHIYYANELDKMVNDMELSVAAKIKSKTASLNSP